MLCVSVCLGPDYHFTLAVRIARLWYHHAVSYYDVFCYTVVPVMNGHPRDQAKVSVHDRWPLIAGTGGRRQT